MAEGGGGERKTAKRNEQSRTVIKASYANLNAMPFSVRILYASLSLPLPPPVLLPLPILLPFALFPAAYEIFVAN